MTLVLLTPTSKTWEIFLHSIFIFSQVLKMDLTSSSETSIKTLKFVDLPPLINHPNHKNLKSIIIPLSPLALFSWISSYTNMILLVIYLFLFEHSLIFYVILGSNSLSLFDIILVIIFYEALHKEIDLNLVKNYGFTSFGSSNKLFEHIVSL